jgi:abortive infection bacteriophage resistance protein
MSIDDKAAAQFCLERVGYYRLSGYWHPLRETEAGGKSKAEKFKKGASFSTAFDLYIFDKRLRLLLMDAIERVEVGLRVAIADLLGRRNPNAHLDVSELHGNFTRKNSQGVSEHSVWVENFLKCFARSNDESIRSFVRDYPSSVAPIWIAIECWDFGLLSYFCSGMKYEDRELLANRFGLKNHKMLISWVRTLNGVRNSCAHHNRLWNKPLIDHPSPPRLGDHSLLDHLAKDNFAQKRLYSAAVALQFILKSIHPNSSWSSRLQSHFKSFPPSPHLKISASGFPEAWEQLELWNAEGATVQGE